MAKADTAIGGPVPHAKCERLISRAQESHAVTTIVAYPCDETSLRGAIEAADAGIIVPILAGPAAKIAGVASQPRRGRQRGAAHP
jgi:phosphate acetyltransferase